MNVYYLFAICGVVIAAFSQILLKIGANRPHISFIRDYLNVPVIMGYFMMALSVALSMLAYRGVNYMSVPVLESIGFVLVPVLSYFSFKEKFTKYKITGIFVIIAGICVYYL